MIREKVGKSWVFQEPRYPGSYQRLKTNDQTLALGYWATGFMDSLEFAISPGSRNFMVHGSGLSICFRAAFGDPAEFVGNCIYPIIGVFADEFILSQPIQASEKFSRPRD